VARHRRWRGHHIQANLGVSAASLQQLVHKSGATPAMIRSVRANAIRIARSSTTVAQTIQKHAKCFAVRKGAKPDTIQARLASATRNASNLAIVALITSKLVNLQMWKRNLRGLLPKTMLAVHQGLPRNELLPYPVKTAVGARPQCCQHPHAWRKEKKYLLKAGKTKSSHSYSQCRWIS